ncbi:MAG: class I SAM-dependent methyltransferase [Candidatus Dadabacteria bacterium]|nr:class I SAM-dependent methyltransferase [Candidatus Dadabacteria bacterium]MYI85876.1 class I SAM-dependent methyltransferase [Dehalococcoidia bacterium]
MRLAAQYKGGYYPTPPRVVEMIASLAQARTVMRGEHTLRILDPCCGGGDALAQLAACIERPDGALVETYGVELHAERAKEAEQRLDHALGTDLFQTAIANGAFGLLYLNPPYDSDAGDDRRTEQSFLRQTTRYLAVGGLLVFVVPLRRLAESERYLASHYARLRVWNFPEPEREAFGQVVVTGTRKADVQYDQYVAVALREAIEGDLEDLRQHRYPVYNAPATADGEVLFATRTVDPVAAAEESRRSGLWVSTTVTDALWPSEDARTRPLMPLRRGHLAMLVAAGFLDNLQLEADGARILVKGQTLKEMVLVETTPEKETHRERLRTTVVALDLDSGEFSDIAA